MTQSPANLPRERVAFSEKSPFFYFITSFNRLRQQRPQSAEISAHSMIISFQLQAYRCPSSRAHSPPLARSVDTTVARSRDSRRLGKGTSGGPAAQASVA